MTEQHLPPAEDIVAVHWPLHGPYSPELAEVAAQTVAELVRYLNYATGQGAHRALRYASQVYSVVGALTTAAWGLEQTLRQLRARVEELAGDPALVHAHYPGDRHTAQVEAAAAGEYLAKAGRVVAVLARELDAAQTHLSPLGHREESL